MNSTVEELEQAATAFAVAWDPTQRKAAEEKLLAFRKSKEPYELCLKILDFSTNECLLFESARTLGEAVCREWDEVAANSPSRHPDLLRSLLDWARTRHQRVSSYVRESVLGAAVALVKRSCAASRSDSQTPSGSTDLMALLLREAESMMNAGDVSQQVLSVSLLSALLHEMAVTNKCCRMGLTWESHSFLRRQFEENEMPQIFVVLVTMADQMNNYSGDLTVDVIAELSTKVLSALEQVLTWDFLPKRIPRKYVGRFKNTERTSLRPNEKWKQFFADDSLIQLFFKLHMRVRQCSQMGVISMMCIVQLSSLTGVVLEPSLVARDRYYAALVDCLVRHVESLEPIDYEFPLFGELLSNLTVSGHLDGALQSRQAQELMLGIRFLHCFAALIVKCIEGAALEVLVSTENPVCGDTLDKLLSTWTSLLAVIAPTAPLGSPSTTHPRPLPPIAGWVLSDPPKTSNGPSTNNNTDEAVHKALSAGITTCRVLNARVFDCYMRSHLAAPDGFRNRTPDGHVIAENDHSEIDVECEGYDNEVFEESLYAVGLLGCEVPASSLPTLSHLLHDRTALLLSSPASLSQTWLLEDLHWILLLAGHLLAQTEPDSGLGSHSPISEALMRHSMMQLASPPETNSSDMTSLVKRSDLEATRQHLISCLSVGRQQSSGLVPVTSDDNVDDVFKLVGACMSLLWPASSRNDSPQVAADVFWVVTRIVKTFFATDEEQYAELSPILIYLLDTETSTSVLSPCVEVLLESCELALKTWSNESMVLERISQLLLVLTDRKETARVVVSRERWWSMVQPICSLSAPFDVYPINVLHILGESVIAAGKVLAPAQQTHYWNMTLQPIGSRCEKVFSSLSASSSALSASEETWRRDEIVNCLILLHGVSRGVRIETTDSIFSLLILPQLEKAINVVQVYHSSAEVMHPLLELFGQMTERCLIFLPVSLTGQLYQLVMKLIHLYSQKNLTKRSFEVNAEEEQFTDIQLLLALLTNLLAKEFIDYDGEATKAEEEGFPSATEIVVYALNSLIPLMNEDMLRLPDLCSQYYKLLNYVCEVNPGKVWQLPEPVFKAMLNSVQLGLHNYTSEICKLCLEMICGLAEFLLQSSESPETSKSEALLPFLPQLFQLFTQDSFDLDVTDVASATVLALICCNKTNYRSVVSTCLSQLPQDQGQRLCSSFEALTPNLDTLDMSRGSKLSFVERFEKFILEARAFLCVY